MEESIPTKKEIKLVCTGCGVKLKVSFVRQKGYNEKEFFNCPSCNEFHFVRAAIAIKKEDVIVLV